MKKIFLLLLFLLVPILGNCATAVLSYPLTVTITQSVDVASVYGFNGVDDTTAIQNAINSGAAAIRLRNMGSPWQTRPLACHSNQTIIIGTGTTLMAVSGQYHGNNDSVFTAQNLTNVNIIGEDLTSNICMRQYDYTQAGYSASQWRHGIYFLSVDGGTISNLTIRETGGDGIFLGAFSGQMSTRNISVYNVTMDRNYRQGCSINSGRNITFTSCVFSNTGQFCQNPTGPCAGFDGEGDDNTMELNNINFYWCSFFGNRHSNSLYSSGQFLFNTAYMTPSGNTVSGIAQNCSITAACTNGIGIQIQGPLDTGVYMDFTFADCNINSTVSRALWIRSKNADNHRAGVKFLRCDWKNLTTGSTTTPPFLFTTDTAYADYITSLGGVSFIQNSVLDTTGATRYIMELGAHKAAITGVHWIEGASGWTLSPAQSHYTTLGSGRQNITLTDINGRLIHN